MSFKSSVVGNMSILGVWKPKIPSNPSCISLQLRIWKSSPRGSLLPKVSDSRTCASEFTPIPCVLHGPVCADETINSTKRNPPKISPYHLWHKPCMFCQKKINRKFSLWLCYLSTLLHVSTVQCQLICGYVHIYVTNTYAFVYQLILLVSVYYKFLY